MSLKNRILKIEEQSRSQAATDRGWTTIDPKEAAETYHRIMNAPGPSASGIITTDDPNEAAKQYIEFINKRS